MSISDGTAERVRATANEVRDAMTARTVYGEAVTAGGVTVLPAARVRGGYGGGGGGGTEAGREGSGMGLGYGLSARPVGAFVIDGEGRVRWKPAGVDRVLMFIMGCLVVIAYLVLARRA